MAVPGRLACETSEDPGTAQEPFDASSPASGASRSVSRCSGLRTCSDTTSSPSFKPVSSEGAAAPKKQKKKPRNRPSVANASRENSRKSAPEDPTASAEAQAEQLARELAWCIEQLELGLRTQRATPKQKDKVSGAIRTLRSERASLPQKRQVMHFFFGNYRLQMETERRQALRALRTAADSAKVQPVGEVARKKSCRVCRPKSVRAVKAPLDIPDEDTPDEEFRFNFF